MPEKKKLSLFSVLYKIFLAGGYVFGFLIFVYLALQACYLLIDLSYDLPGKYTISKKYLEEMSKIRNANKETVLEDVFEFGFCGKYVYGSYYSSTGYSDFVIDTESGRIEEYSRKMDGIDFRKYPAEQQIAVDEARYYDTKGIGWKNCY